MSQTDYTDTEKEAYAQGVQKGKQLGCQAVAEILEENTDLAPETLAKIIFSVLDDERTA